MIFFESRGKNKVMSEMTRSEQLELVIEQSIGEFIYKYLYGGLGKGIVLTEKAIDEFEIAESEKEFCKRFLRDLLIESLMSYKGYLINILNSIGNKGIVVRIKEVQKSLEIEAERRSVFNHLDNFYCINSYFREYVIDEIDREIREHLIDIEDVESGRVIKTISQKKKEFDEEYELLYGDGISSINSSYWADYEDQIRAVRGLDDDCHVF